MKSSLFNGKTSAATASTVKTDKETSNASSPPVTVESLDTNFMPIIYDIVRSIEKEVHETPVVSKGTSSREPQDYHVKVQQFNEKLDKTRAQIQQIKGIEVSREEQLKRVELLKNQLSSKRELLAKYKNQCPIDGIPKGSFTPRTFFDSN